MFQQTSFVDSEKKFRDHGYEPCGEAHVHHSSVLDQMAPETHVLIRDMIKLQHKVNVTCLKDLKKCFSKAIKCRHLLCVDFDFIGFIQ